MKHIPRIFLDQKLQIFKKIELSALHYNHLKNVLKLKLNDQLFVFNSNDGEFCARIQEINKKTIIINIQKKNNNQTDSLLNINESNDSLFNINTATDLTSNIHQSNDALCNINVSENNYTHGTKTISDNNNTSTVNKHNNSLYNDNNIDTHNHRHLYTQNNLSNLNINTEYSTNYQTQKCAIAFALINPKKITDLLDKCTQLNVAEFFPIITQNTHFKDINCKKFLQTIIQSCEQCNRIDIPKLHEKQSLKSFLEKYPNDIIIGIERGSQKEAQITKKCCFLIGPEGGFSKQELKYMNQELQEKDNIDTKYTNISQKIKTITIGQTVLRSETAAITFAAIYNYKFLK